ncbi:hypothetical protein IQ264_16050 [Phormidium sp. LEGE 05292]|uniref:hypothetical protein n=1 Tax=[Phormidium] sp. LEGE 05292 TaxID=767427 RepID=UPI001880991B|nr:hypothetical protein [Phormidium sp. LEGE 05292]MBE9226941.1 hypothetical protein [Phormidium sp. LEGE 05292]
MKLQKSTLILILIALIFGGVVYIWEVEGKPRREAAKLRENRVFAFEEKDVQNVVLKTKEYKLQFDRVKPQASSISTEPKWTVKVLEKYQVAETKTPESSTETRDRETKTPESSAELKSTETKTPESTETATRKRRKSRQETELPEDLALAFWGLMPNSTQKDEVTLLTAMPANEAYIAYLLNELATGKGDRIIADPRIEDGIDKPLATVEITLNNGEKHQLILGNLNYNNTALYAVADPPQQLTKPLDILLVPINFQNAVNRPLSEWKQQEIQPTPTPEASPKTEQPVTEESKKESPPPKTDKPVTEESKKESPPPTKEKPRLRRTR